MKRSELDEILRGLDFKDPVHGISDLDGLQAEWSSDGDLKRLRFVSRGHSVGWDIDHVQSEATAKIARAGTWTFAATRLCDEFGNPEETLAGWVRRWVSAVVRHGQNSLICSFCERNSKQAKAMMPGTLGAFICDQCALMIADIMRDQLPT